MPWLLVLALCACNQAFGLESTDLEPDQVDRDNDGVVDADDNCPTVENDQSNGDLDAFGDACDLCPAVSSEDNHDEDHDGIGDPCDLCPGRPDFGADLDNDGVGNECDLDSARPSTRAGFEAFAVQRGASSVTWSSEGDSTGPDVPLGSNAEGLAFPAMEVSGGSWWVEARMHLLQPWQAGDRFGIVIRGASGAEVLSCWFECSEQACAFHTTSSMATASAAPQPTMIVRIEVLPTGFACRIPGFTVTGGILPPPQTLHPTLLASPNARIAYVEAIR